MNKIKYLLLLLLGVLLVDFAVENALPGPTFKLFHFELGEVPIFLVVYVSLALGILIGWLIHFLRAKKKKRAASSTPEQAQSQDTSQEQKYQ